MRSTRGATTNPGAAGAVSSARRPLSRMAARAAACLLIAGVVACAALVSARSATDAEERRSPVWRELVRAKWGPGSQEVGARETEGKGLCGPMCLTADPLGGSRVLVADWVNTRVQIWNGKGEFVGSRALPDIGPVVDIAVTRDDRVYVTNGRDIGCEEPGGPRLLSTRNILPGSIIGFGVLRNYKMSPRAHLYLEQDGAVGYLGQDDLNWIRVYSYADGLQLAAAARGRDVCVSPWHWGKCYTLVAPGLGEQPAGHVRVAAAESDEVETDILEFPLPTQPWPVHQVRLLGVREVGLDRFYILISANPHDARRAAVLQYDRRSLELIEQIPLPARPRSGGAHIGDLYARVAVDGTRYCYLACSDPDGYTILQARFRDEP